MVNQTDNIIKENIRINQEKKHFFAELIGKMVV